MISRAGALLVADLCVCGAGLLFLLLAALMILRLRSDARRDRYYRGEGR
jgi:hypothetical protein